MNRNSKLAAGAVAGVACAIAVGVGSASASVPHMNLRPCAPGETPQMNGSMPSCIPPGFGNGGNGGTGGVGGNGGAGGPGNAIPGVGMLPPLPACAPGVLPTREAPCAFDFESLPDCAEGVDPSPEKPCRPQGLNPQFDFTPPPEATKKLLTLDVDVDGSGEDPGTFDVTLNRIVKGIGKAQRAAIESQIEGESFVINATRAKCFADRKSDRDSLPDKVSCRVLSEETDDVAAVLKATVVTRMKFDPVTRTPTFTATKFVIRGKNKI